MSERYPKENRLRSKADFYSLKEGSRKFRDPFISVFFKNTDLKLPRVAFSINSKHFNAVERNRLKRLMRDIFRHQINQLSSVDFLVVVQSKKKEIEFAEFTQNITCSFRKFLLNLVVK
ncbi:MAG: ribonuclease P protein component [Bacteriovoracaceae bacterium]